MLTRYATAISSGTLITVALLYVMQLLITLQPGVRSERGPGKPVILTRTIIDEPPTVKKTEPLTREKLTKSEPTPSRVPREGATDRVGVRSGEPPAPTAFGLPEFGVMTDGPLASIVRVAPIYPARAASQGVEGYVIVEFDVLPDGRVTNVAVIESSNRVFDKSAVDAAYKFRFKPAVVDGIALATSGLRNRFTFLLDD